MHPPPVATPSPPPHTDPTGMVPGCLEVRQPRNKSSLHMKKCRNVVGSVFVYNTGILFEYCIDEGESKQKEELVHCYTEPRSKFLSRYEPHTFSVILVKMHSLMSLCSHQQNWKNDCYAIKLPSHHRCAYYITINLNTQQLSILQQNHRTDIQETPHAIKFQYLPILLFDPV